MCCFDSDQNNWYSCTYTVVKVLMVDGKEIEKVSQTVYHSVSKMLMKWLYRFL